jgi:outer membrane protein
MNRTTFCAVLALAGLATAAQAHADERFYIRGGPAFATFDASATVSVAGPRVPGGSASVKNNTGLIVEGGWFIRPDWALALAVGIPPKAKINGDGTLKAAGLLGTARYGPSAFGVQYHVPTSGAFRPYLGGGASYTLVFDVKDSAIHKLKVSDGYGVYIEAGAEYRVSPRIAVYADVKKIWVAVNAKGFTDTPAGLLPAKARVDLDPLIVNTGLSFHF